MKELGNIAVVCAKRNDVLMQISAGITTIYVGSGSNRTQMSFAWHDDAKISEIIHELNFGKYAVKKEEPQNA